MLKVAVVFMAAVALGIGTFFAGYHARIWYEGHRLMAYTFETWSPANQWFHDGELPVGPKTWVKAPNPNAIISRASYDLRDGPVRIRGQLPEGTYWSLSLYGDDSVALVSLNDQEIGTRRVDHVLIHNSMNPDDIHGMNAAQAVPGRSWRGYAVLRFLVPTPESYEAVRASQLSFTMTACSVINDALVCIDRETGP